MQEHMLVALLFMMDRASGNTVNIAEVRTRTIDDLMTLVRIVMPAFWKGEAGITGFLYCQLYLLVETIYVKSNELGIDTVQKNRGINKFGSSGQVCTSSRQAALADQVEIRFRWD